MEAGIIAAVVAAGAALVTGIGAVLRRVKRATCCCGSIQCDEERARVKKLSRAASRAASEDPSLVDSELEEALRRVRTERNLRSLEQPITPVLRRNRALSDPARMNTPV